MRFKIQSASSGRGGLFVSLHAFMHKDWAELSTLDEVDVVVPDTQLGIEDQLIAENQALRSEIAALKKQLENGE